MTPAVSEWLDRNDGVGTIGAYRQFIRDLLPRFPGLIVVDAQDVGWDHSAFRDPIHLNRDGAGRLSLAVAELIRQCSAGSANGHRWLKPDAQADPACDGIQDLMEDLDQSQAAVARRASGPG